MGLDLVVANGLVIDGTGSPGSVRDIGIEDGRIAWVGTGDVPRGTPVIDATGMLVAPGFVDIHTHSDVSLLHDGRAESKLLQGVTTEVTGNCSFSPFPIDPARIDLHRDHLARIGDDPITPTWTDLDGYAAELERRGTAINVAPLLGHGTVRVAVLGVDDRQPDATELDRMRALADQAFAQGAFGFSTGLTHVPSAYGGAPEIHALAEVAQRHGRVYTTHARATAGGAFSAIEEAIEVGRRTGVRVEFSHLAINEPHLWGHAAEVLALFDRAREEGIDVAFDVYPYDASSSSLTQYLPPWVQEGGTEAMRARLADPDTHARALVDLAAGWFGGIPWHWERIVISRTGPGGEALIGRSIKDIAAEQGRPPQDVMLETCLTYGNEAECVLFYRTEQDMLAFLTHPLGVVGSDGSAIPLDQHGDKPHPRHFGSFPRIFGKYARERGALSFEEAVAKTSTRPAERIHLRDRGRLVPGLAADIVVMDPERVIDRATYIEPCQAPVGIRDVLIGGVASVRDGALTGARPGRVLRAGRG
ncbi:MAG: D-aminoacylase [Chloroflexota bacterium]